MNVKFDLKKITFEAKLNSSFPKGPLERPIGVGIKIIYFIRSLKRHPLVNLPAPTSSSSSSPSSPTSEGVVNSKAMYLTKIYKSPDPQQGFTQNKIKAGHFEKLGYQSWLSLYFK